VPSPSPDGNTVAIKRAVNIVDVIGEQISLTRRGRTFKGLCPFHKDHRPSLNVDPERQIYKCFSCNAGGDVFDFVMNFERVGFREALESLAQRAGITLSRVSSRSRSDREQSADILKWAEEEFRRCFWDSPMGAPARQYAEKRGLSADSLRVFGIGFAPKEWDWLVKSARARRFTPEQLQKCGLAQASSGRNSHIDWFRGRLMFPIRDARGKTIAFGGRILPEYANDREGKYNNSPAPFFAKSEHLYGLDQARDAIRSTKAAVVVEGYTDCIMAHQLGLKHVVGTLGTALGGAHVTTLRRYADRIILVYDGDRPGQDAADRALSIILSSEVDLRILPLTGDLDPCDYLLQKGAEDFRKGLDSAGDALDFKLRRAGRIHDLTTINGRRQALDYVLSAIAAMPVLSTGSTPVTREIVLDRLGQRLGIPAETVRKRLRELRPKARRGRPDVNEPAKPADAGWWNNESFSERELMEALLAAPNLIPEALNEITLEEIKTLGFRRMLEVCIELSRDGRGIELDELRLRLEDRELACRASILAETGREKGSVERRLADVLAYFKSRRDQAASRSEVARGDVPDSDEAKRQFLALKFQKAQSRQRNTQRHAM
jgi:DNA primase